MESVFIMVIWSEFRMDRYRDDGHHEDPPHFNIFFDNIQLNKSSNKNLKMMKFTITLAATFNVAAGQKSGQACGPVMPMPPLQYTCPVSSN